MASVSPVKPNPHPYSIKTTSTALLSRSNSTNASSNGHSHHYIPSNPSPTNSHIRSNSSAYRGHRYSRSLSDDIPRPLPLPPSPTKLAEPSNPQPFEDNFEDQNPKRWTPYQLSAYLATALRVKSGESLESLPAPIAKDIANFVREARITGKAFLRLSEADLDDYGVSKMWRATLLTASRNLRQNVLKGRIWGFGNSIEDSPHSPISSAGSADDDEENTPNSRLRRSNARKPSYTKVVQNPFVGGKAFSGYSSASSSSSVEDLHSDPAPGRGRIRNGRVKGMVQSFERSSSLSESEDPSRPPFIRSGSDISGAEPEDDSFYATAKARDVMRPLPPVPAVAPYEVNGEEPSMEELLASTPSEYPLLVPNDSVGTKNTIISSGRRKKRGVHAWEADDASVATAKRVVSAIPTGASASMLAASHIFEEPGSENILLPARDEEFCDEVAQQEHILEADLLQSINSTKGMIESFQERLAEVEGKIKEMERMQEEKKRQEEEAQSSKTKEVSQQELSPTQSPRVIARNMLDADPPTLYSKALTIFFGLSPTVAAGSASHDADMEQRRRRRERLSAYDRLLNPDSIGALPSYVILVSLGMCAVVFKVLTRRGIRRP